MTREERLEKIEALEKIRGSRVISYLTADRGVANTQVTEDVVRIMYDHVSAIGDVEKLDLLIYSRGGDGMVPWPLVNMLRSRCKTFSVLVPYRAHSAATMIALGADEIVMSPIGQLTPVEPTKTMPFSPEDKANPGKKLGINVEDVATYFKFVKERAEIESEQGMASALAALTSQVNPIALGNLHRSYESARMQTCGLLGLHMDPKEEKAAIDGIVKRLVTELWAHEYKIGIDEADRLNLKVTASTTEVQAALWVAYLAYEESMDLRTPISPANAFPPGQAAVEIKDVKLTYIESTEATNVFVSDLQLTRPTIATPPGQPQQFGPQVQIAVMRQEWLEEPPAPAPAQPPAPPAQGGP